MCFTSCHTNFFLILCFSFSLSASVSTFHTLSLDLLASCSFLFGLFEICLWFPRKSHVGQLSKLSLLIQWRGLASFRSFRYETNLSCQSKSLWLKNSLDVSKEMNRTTFVNEDKPEREKNVSSRKDLKLIANWREKNIKRFLGISSSILNKRNFWRVEIILWIAKRIFHEKFFDLSFN